MVDVKWIKLRSDIFENRKIKQIESLPDGDAIIVIWLKLLCLAGNINDDGKIYFTKEIPFTDQMFSAYFNRPISTIQFALNIFEQFGMVENFDGLLVIKNWEKYQNLEGLERIRELNKERNKKYRERKKQALLESPDIMTSCVTSRDASEKKRKEEKREENILLKESIENFLVPDEISFLQKKYSGYEGLIAAVDMKIKKIPEHPCAYIDSFADRCHWKRNGVDNT